tara:strand:+ start:270 stop:938 length:669 start_codon:yes stop_codon:yes gene_type:complete
MPDEVTKKMAGADDGAHEPDAARRALARERAEHRRAAALERSEHARACPWGHEAYKNPFKSSPELVWCMRPELAIPATALRKSDGGYLYVSEHRRRENVCQVQISVNNKLVRIANVAERMEASILAVAALVDERIRAPESAHRWAAWVSSPAAFAQWRSEMAWKYLERAAPDDVKVPDVELAGALYAHVCERVKTARGRGRGVARPLVLDEDFPVRKRAAVA